MLKVMLKARKRIYPSMRPFMAMQVKLDNHYTAGRNSRASVEPAKERITIMTKSQEEKVNGRHSSVRKVQAKVSCIPF